VAGYPHRTIAGQLSLLATELPRILSPCLHQFPAPKLPGELSLENESQSLDKHVDMLANYDTTPLIMRRSEIVREMRMFLDRGGYIEVQTPILSTKTGGAAAKPFKTSATEFSRKQLSLRVAPELWLKRLILGGMDRIFEIGSCFRNEGKSSTGYWFFRQLTLCRS
jgi:lysyl-tRNA synthetase, class II